jgi:hypothetical protein
MGRQIFIEITALIKIIFQRNPNHAFDRFLHGACAQAVSGSLQVMTHPLISFDNCVSSKNHDDFTRITRPKDILTNQNNPQSE